MADNRLQTAANAVNELSDAVNVAGADPQYHNQWLQRLADEWTPLAAAIVDVLRATESPVPQAWQEIARARS